MVLDVLVVILGFSVLVGVSGGGFGGSGGSIKCTCVGTRCLRGGSRWLCMFWWW